MQKHFALFFLSAVFALMAHAAEDLTTTKADNARHPAQAPHTADNSACPYANDNLLYALPGSTATNLWREDGHVRVPASAMSTENGVVSQKIVMKGGGVRFAQNAGKHMATTVELAYDDIGGLKRLKVSKLGSHQTIDYAMGPQGCDLVRVTEDKPGFNTFVSFDAKLCQKLKDKQLLDPKTVETCNDYNSKVGNAITEYANSLPANERFGVFKSDAAGGVSLHTYDQKEFGAVNAVLANDCLVSWHGTKGAPASDEGVERGSKPESPTAL